MDKLSNKYLIALSMLWIAFAGWAISSPVGSAPDDDFHIGSIWCAGGFEVGVCKDAGSANEIGAKSVLIPVVNNSCFVGRPSQPGKCFQSETTPDLQKFRANDGLYPKIFYRVQHIFVGDDAFTSIYKMRLFNSTMAVIALGLALLFGRRELRIGLIAAWTFTLVPLGMFIIPSTNPSSWAFTGLATNWVFQMSAMRLARREKLLAICNWLMYLLTALMCIGSRSDGAVYVVFSTVIVALIGYSLGAERKLVSLIFPTLVCCISAWSISSTSQGSDFTPIGKYRDLPIVNRIIYNTIHVIEIPAGALGMEWGLGWIDTFLPPIVGIIGVSLFAITTYNALRIGDRWRNWSALAITGFGYVVIMFVLIQGGFIVGETVQPRYILPLLPLFIGLTTMANLEFDKSMRIKSWRFAIIAMLTATNSISIYTNIRRYVTGMNEKVVLSLNIDTEWWRLSHISPNTAFLITSISFSMFLTMIWKLLADQNDTDRLPSIN